MIIIHSRGQEKADKNNLQNFIISVNLIQFSYNSKVSLSGFLTPTAISQQLPFYSSKNTIF